jgi:hypothetical protein
MPRMYCSHVAYCTTLDIRTLTTSRLMRDPGGQRWSETLLFLEVPTFATSRLPRDSSNQRWNYVGEKWPINFAWNARLPRSIQWSFTCRKSTTLDRRLYCPSEGRRAEDFFALKNPTASAGFERICVKNWSQKNRPFPRTDTNQLVCVIQKKWFPGRRNWLISTHQMLIFYSI